MGFKFKALWAPKDFENPQFCEDAFSVDESTGRVALADGVGTAIFSAEWARILTRSTVQEPPSVDQPIRLDEWLDRARQLWRTEVSGVKLEWHQRPKMIDGAMATLLWLEFPSLSSGVDASGGVEARAFAIGDTCLFHYRGTERLASFPLTLSQEFGLSPSVLRSIDRFRQDAQLQFQRWESTCLSGDLIVLCTDAVALWALRQAESGSPIDWNRFWDTSPDEWTREIQLLREQGEMRVDDCSLVLLRVDGISLETPTAA